MNDIDTDELRSMRDYLMSRAEYDRKAANEYHDEIVRRTSPWPWPRSVQRYPLPPPGTRELFYAPFVLTCGE